MQDHGRDAILAKSREVGYDALTPVEKAAVAAAVSVADPGELHWPGRAHCLESLEGHLIKASRLARVMWNAMENGDLALDERDRLGLYELASSVADHASGACYAFYLEREREAAASLEKIEADPVFVLIAEWRRLEDAHIAAVEENDRLGSEEADEAQTRACHAVQAFERSALFQARPTTAAGAATLLRLIADIIGPHKGGECAPALRAAAAVFDREESK
jgi:hypothetical protein